jgi:hypothetical protein
MLKNTVTPLVLAFAALAAQGCTVYSYDTVEDPYYTDVYYETEVVYYNAAPVVLDAQAGVFFDDRAYDDVWYFDALVDDADGPYDIIGVWADVYDECRGGALVESFELYPTNDPYVWYSEWAGRTTFLDPFHDCYTVDFVAYDTFEAFDFMTVWALTY